MKPRHTVRTRRRAAWSELPSPRGAHATEGLAHTLPPGGDGVLSRDLKRVLRRGDVGRSEPFQ